MPDRRHPAIRLVLAIFATLAFCLPVAAQDLKEDEPPTPYTIEAPRVVLDGVPFTQSIRASVPPAAPLTLEVGEESYEVAPDDFTQLADSVAYLAEVEDVTATGDEVTMRLLEDGEVVAEGTTNAIAGWLSILPALIAIGIALATRQVIPALFLGIVLGSWFTYGMSLPGLWFGLLDTIQIYVLEALVPPDGSKSHMQIVIFTLMMGGMIGIIYRNGGAHAIAARIASIANTRRKTQLGACGLGFAIFFSTYANSLIVGNTMRPVTDRMKISREKLAYIVDSTAAPLASIAIISTWIGYQLGLIEEAVSGIGVNQSAYSIFLNAIPYNFYPILALVMVILIGAMGRDFGPMAKAERRALEEGQVIRQDADAEESDDEEGGELYLKDDVTQRSINAILPIGTLIVMVAAGLYVTGEGSTLREIMGSADGNTALVWAALVSVVLAAGLSMGQGLLSMKETMGAWFAGLRSVLFVMIILTLAWSLAAIAEDLHTASWLVSILGDSIPPQWLPAILFCLSAAVSFAVGTSWGTMGILMPLAVPLIWALMQNAGLSMEEDGYILYATIGTILAGSVWGDHCSPISDTTIISSVASGSNHIDHVRTQIPYALTVGGVAIVCGLIPTGYGIPFWITLPLGAVALVAILWVLGTSLGTDVAPDAEEAEGETARA
ncbi:Na+/H+ antiporter NhaC [Palleronia aestuarii]|uniref:Na+/H+ antiporter NhaC n=1 Tax=Palleronia aestuarii TaxID=568105 RepID=A0A2W7NIC0_9RHOB|nr:Na+/H+ antiporter NhaC family protein [Palleronia aestuarii]PZX12906.1 Na+/H+ antiporter NhaC [Palleronia aestuarii]